MIFKKSYEQAKNDAQEMIDNTIDILDERLEFIAVLASIGIAVGILNTASLWLIYKELAK